MLNEDRYPCSPNVQTFPSLAYQNQNLFVGCQKKKKTRSADQN